MNTVLYELSKSITAVKNASKNNDLALEKISKLDNEIININDMIRSKDERIEVCVRCGRPINNNDTYYNMNIYGHRSNEETVDIDAEIQNLLSLTKEYFNTHGKWCSECIDKLCDLFNNS